MEWKDVGEWLSKNGKGLVGLAGAVATGNVPAGVSAVASMVAEATGENSPQSALDSLKSDPASMVKLQEIAATRESDIRLHHRETLRLQLEDQQKAHKEQQDTIRNGDSSSDEYVRHTRPMMARQSWYATAAYVFLGYVMKATGVTQDAISIEVALLLLAPAGAYLGFRTADKIWKSSSK